MDILIAYKEGLSGFSDAINTVFPRTRIQLCVIHQLILKSSKTLRQCKKLKRRRNLVELRRLGIVVKKSIGDYISYLPTRSAGNIEEENRGNPKSLSKNENIQ